MYKITPGKIFNRKVLVAVICFVIAAGILSAYVTWQWLFKKNINPEGKNLVVYVKTNQSYDEFYNTLVAMQILKHQKGFRQVAGWLKLHEKMKPGRYVINKPLTSLEFISLLISGRQQPFNITFNYAEKLNDVAQFFASKLEASETEILQYLHDTAVLNQLGFDSLNVISLFIPNTYNFYWNTSASQLVKRMEKEYHQFWNENRVALARQINLTPQQVSIIASIVQKETNKTDEMPVIAGVYINRLQKNMPLQADPTIIFMLNDKNIKRVKAKHYTIPSPYNTYLNTGLPPGPICTAEPAAIDAVLNYTKHRYLYFCAKDDLSGYHVFAKSFNEHLLNAKKYQKALNKLGIM